MSGRAHMATKKSSSISSVSEAVFLPDLVIRSRRVVTPARTGPAAVHIRRGQIIGVLDFDDVPAGCPLDDAEGAVVIPGIVDTHVHVNEPGRTEWEGFETATRAAAAGGVTTIVDMPLNSIPATTTPASLEAKRRAAEGKCHVDVGFWGGVVPGNARELAPLFSEGVLGFKCFLVDSGVPEFPATPEADLGVAMATLARIGAPLLVHAELPGPIEAAAARRRADLGWLAPLAGVLGKNRQYSAYLASRPKEAEDQAIAVLIRLCREYRTRTHVVHLSSSDALTPIFHARSAGLPITAEACPHYLYFVAEEIPDGGTAFKCAPPIRGRENREFLWAALAGGLIQMIASDHSPAPPALKQVTSGDFFRAWGGISSLQVSLPVTWTEASARGYSLNQLAEWMCRGPARLAGLNRKGAIEVGYDADLVIWEPDAAFTVDAGQLWHRHPLTPYSGRQLRGVVDRAYLGGERIYKRGSPIPAPRGRLLARLAP
jgi:allantoinase